MSYTCAISGPSRTRAKAEVALERAGLRPLPDDHHAVMNWQSKYPDDGDDWITVQAKHPDEVVTAVENANWRLRVHYLTPDEPAPAHNGIAATLADMQAEIAALKAKVG